MYPNDYLVKAHIAEIHRSAQRMGSARLTLGILPPLPTYRVAVHQLGEALVTLGVRLLQTRGQVHAQIENCTQIVSRPIPNGRLVIEQCPSR